jgi:hypothetical protein
LNRSNRILNLNQKFLNHFERNQKLPGNFHILIKTFQKHRLFHLVFELYPIRNEERKQRETRGKTSENGEKSEKSKISYIFLIGIILFH